MKNALKEKLMKINVMYIFFIIIFCFTLSSFFMFKPFAKQVSAKNLATLELFNFNLKQADEKSIFMDVNGANAKQFKTEDIFSNFDAKRLQDGVMENLKGDLVIRRGNIYHFPNGVNYTKGDNMSFYSQSGIYDMNKNIFTGRGEFVINNASMQSRGFDIIYDKKNDTITGNDMNSTIQIKDHNH